MELIYKIKRTRQELRISEKEMSDALNISQATYSRIESGATKLKLEHVLKISQVLGLSLEELIGECEFKQLKSNENVIISKLEEILELLKKNG